MVVVVGKVHELFFHKVFKVGFFRTGVGRKRNHGNPQKKRAVYERAVVYRDKAVACKKGVFRAFVHVQIKFDVLRISLFGLAKHCGIQVFVFAAVDDKVYYVALIQQKFKHGHKFLASDCPARKIHGGIQIQTQMFFQFEDVIDVGHVFLNREAHDVHPAA